jgi:peptide deformylase
MVAAVLAAEVAAGLAAAVVGVEARLAAVVVAAEAHPVVVAGADATVFSQSAE